MNVRIVRSVYGNNNGKILDVVVNENGDYLYGVGLKQILILKEDAEVVEDVEKSCKTCKFYEKDRDLKYLTHCTLGKFIECLENNSLKHWESMNGETESIKIKTGTTEEAKHYQVAEVQPIEIMQMYLTPEEMVGGLKWQVIKYILRIGHKGSDREDAGKCNQYSQWLCDVMDGKTIVPGGKDGH